MTVATKSPQLLVPSFPDNGRKYEWINGKAQEVPTGFQHDVIAAQVGYFLSLHARLHGAVTSSQAGFWMANGNLRCPDVGFTRWERLPEADEVPTGFVDFAPDLCVEVISPSETRADMQGKVEEYFASGAQQVWQLFPGEQRVRAFRSPELWRDFGPDDLLETGDDLLPGFRVVVSELFAIRPPSANR